MAEQILTQLEVDALLKGLSNGDIQTEVEKVEVPSGELVSYDFVNHERAVRGKMYTLDMVNEKFCRLIRVSMFNLMRKAVDIVPEGVTTMKYEAFLRNLTVPSSLNIFQLPPLRGQGVLVIDPNLVYIIVDNYFGGDGRFHTRVEGKDFTNVEQSVIKKVVDIIFHEMTEVWKPVHPIEFKFTRAEMNPQFINIISHGEQVVIITFRMEVESNSNKFFFCIPYSSFDPINAKLYGAPQVEAKELDSNWPSKLREQFDQVPLAVSCEVGRATISVSQLLGLKAGDVIQLNKKARDPFDMYVETSRKFNVRPGIIDGNYALKIESAVKEGGK